ncbi:hypothetical protein B0I35DRAFT_415037 [Stachybotrys elegans]|uniref:Uncharacterized protein n=1 Tax=Stachybotrys elegans TaxID=80388 RepID=A0A8K0WK27_9HYPO|nr:hypothetical protein B0I35DRAFT_415037 [Stachybotrys elegans]
MPKLRVENKPQNLRKSDTIPTALALHTAGGMMSDITNAADFAVLREDALCQHPLGLHAPRGDTHLPGNLPDTANVAMPQEGISYEHTLENHINIFLKAYLPMHPIFWRPQVDTFVKEFLGNKTKVAAIQRSVEQPGSTDSGAVKMNVKDAIVLFMLALGKLCSDSQRVPRFPTMSSHPSNPEPTSPGVLSPSLTGSPSQCNTENSRNYNLPTGKEYSEFGFEILRTSTDRTQEFAWARLLAGLYLVHQDQPEEARNSFHQAQRVLEVILTRNPSELYQKDMIEESSFNISLFDWWYLNSDMTLTSQF